MVTIKVDEIKNQIAWDAFVGSGIIGNLFLYTLLKKLVMQIKKKLSKIGSDKT